jgi:hypothetical protein
MRLILLTATLSIAALAMPQSVPNNETVEIQANNKLNQYRNMDDWYVKIQLSQEAHL